jgi:DMSO reductase anchor subunit
MLVLTQLSVGAVTAGVIARWLSGADWCDAVIVIGMLAGQAGLAVAPLHLGRPHLAFRAVLGWRHSWLSREAILFGVYAAFSGAAAMFALLPHIETWLPTFVSSVTKLLLPIALRSSLEALAIVSGVAAVYCSAKIYIFTGRTFWNAKRSLPTFGGTAVVLGLALATTAAAFAETPQPLFAWLTIAAVSAKLFHEAAVFRHLDDAGSGLRLTAKLQLGELRSVSAVRFSCGVAGIALLMLAAAGIAPGVTAMLGVVALLTGEFAERWLYFSSVVPLRMPGGMPTR